MYYQKIVTFELLVNCLEMISENYRSAKKKKKKKKKNQNNPLSQKLASCIL